MKNPEIRFIDDNIDWEERKLGELNNLSIPTIYKNYYLEIGDIKPLSNSYTLDKTKKIVSGAKLATNGTILVSTVRPTRGAICKLKDGNIFVSSALYQFNSNNEFLNDIILQQLQTYKFLKYCGDNCEGGTYPTISKENIDKFIVKIPKNVEKISKTLTSIDVKITNQTAIIEKLYNTKSALLIKMFPQENQSVPELRFDGFTDTWEQRKLSDIFEERHIVSTISDKYPQLSFTIAEGVIKPEDRKTNKRDFLIIDKANKKYLITEYDDIIYNPANVIFGAIHRNALGKGCVSPIYKIFYTDFDSKFIECIVRNESFINKISQNLEGTVTKLKTLKPEAFLNMSSYITTSMEEQTKIGNLFEKLNNLITLHQRKPFHLNFSL